MSRRKAVEILWVYALASVMYGVFAVFLLFPMHPISPTGWGIWFAAAVPVTLIGESVGSVLFNNRTGQVLGPDTDGVSMTRVAYGIVVAIVLMLAILLVASEFDLLADASWDRHFSRNW